MSKDGSYVLSLGSSYRDYDTLIKAIKKLNYPTKVILPEKSQVEYHNTYLEDSFIADNIEIIRHDYNYDTWNDYIANARLVVIPITKAALQPAGISVYLEAMALGKPVIVSEGPSTKGILVNNEAEIVPAEDSEALASAIEKIWSDKNYRDYIAANGKKYALSLGGEERLVKDILEEIYAAISIKRNLSDEKGVDKKR